MQKENLKKIHKKVDKRLSMCYNSHINYFCMGENLCSHLL